MTDNAPKHLRSHARAARVLLDAIGCGNQFAAHGGRSSRCDAQSGTHRRD